MIAVDCLKATNQREAHSGKEKENERPPALFLPEATDPVTLEVTVEEAEAGEWVAGGFSVPGSGVDAPVVPLPLPMVTAAGTPFFGLLCFAPTALPLAGVLELDELLVVEGAMVAIVVFVIVQL